MTSAEALPVASQLAEAVRAKLLAAPGPLKLADVLKGLPKPKKKKGSPPPDLPAEVRGVLEEEGRLGKAFCYPSGKNGESRYWSRDEKHLLREKAVELAAIPQELSKLQKALVKEVKGTDPAFAEAVLRELIGEDRLFEHPAKKKGGAALFGASPPPPPLPALEQAKHKKAVEKLVSDCRKLLAAAGVGVEELLQTIQRRVSERPPQDRGAAARTEPPAPVQTATEPESGTTVEELILKAVENAPVVSLAELRRELPSEFRGRAFDDAVLRLADERKVIVSQDADPSRFSDAERAELVQDGGAVFTTVSRWS